MMLGESVRAVLLMGVFVIGKVSSVKCQQLIFWNLMEAEYLIIDTGRNLPTYPFCSPRPVKGV